MRLTTFVLTNLVSIDLFSCVQYLRLMLEKKRKSRRGLLKNVSGLVFGYSFRINTCVWLGVVKSYNALMVN